MRPQKITFGDMRGSGVRGILVYWADNRCSHNIKLALGSLVVLGIIALDVVLDMPSPAGTLIFKAAAPRGRHRSAQ